MVSYYFQVILLAFIQGVSEFIPVSSSAHLILFSYLSKFNYSSLEVDISMHLGSLLAIIVFFRNDLLNLYNKKSFLYLIIFGSMPIILIGFILYYLEIIYLIRDLKLIAWTTLIFGIVLYISDKKLETSKIEKDLNFKNILTIGVFQTLSLVPGVSRSGIVITASRIFNFNRVDAAKISFFLSIPALSGASLLGLKNISDKNIEINLVIFVSILFSYIFSFLTIKFLIFYLKKFSLKFFVYYRILLAIVLFLIAYN